MKERVVADTAAVVLGPILGPQSTLPAPAQCTGLCPVHCAGALKKG
jgi:hypothetical protein